MNNEMIVGLAVLALLILWAMSYTGSKAYLREPFQGASASPLERWAEKPKAKSEAATSGAAEDLPDDTDVVLPYIQDPIDSLGDYEYNMVFQNEADKPLTAKERSALMSQYPLDWSGYPSSAAQFQAGLRESFENASPNVPDDAKPYQNISGGTMSPPDTGAMEAEERKILMTYKPEFPPDPTAYDPADVNDLVSKLYAKKGLVPEIKRRGETNIYDIVGSRPVNEKVEYEDSPAPASGDAVPAAGEGYTQGPEAAGQTPDRFFQDMKGIGSGTGNKWDYTAWTPGLERMFAPTEPQKAWY